MLSGIAWHFTVAEGLAWYQLLKMQDLRSALKLLTWRRKAAIIIILYLHTSWSGIFITWARHRHSHTGCWWCAGHGVVVIDCKNTVHASAFKNVLCVSLNLTWSPVCMKTSSRTCCTLKFPNPFLWNAAKLSFRHLACWVQAAAVNGKHQRVGKKTTFFLAPKMRRCHSVWLLQITLAPVSVPNPIRHLEHRLSIDYGYLDNK